MILLAVLGAVGIIYILIVQMSADVLFTSQYYQKIAFKEKAYYVSRSAFSGVVRFLSFDNQDYDCLSDDWARGYPPIQLDDENMTVSFIIEDQERFFNPNSILKESGEADQEHIEQLRRLLKILELDPDLSNAVKDWIDQDHERTMPGGADGLDYTEEIPVKGRPLDSLEEISLIRGFTPDVLLPGVKVGRKTPGLKELLSVYGEGKININTAPAEILMSLDDDFNREMAQELIRRRTSNPLKTMDQLMELPGVSHDLIYRLKKLADVKSQYFKIVITCEGTDGQSSDLEVVVKRSGQTGKVLFWKTL